MFVKINMDVTSLNQATKKRESVGAVLIYVPTLDELGIKADQAIDGEKKPLVDDEGLPVYAEDKFNYAQGAIYAAVKAQARNKLEAGTATLKAGASIATDWAMLTAEASREGSGLALIAYREAKNLFTAWVNSLSKSAQAKTMIVSLFSSKNALLAQDADNKGKMKAYITEFASSLSADVLAKYERPLTQVLALCDTVTEADDF